MNCQLVSAILSDCQLKTANLTD
ncbi:hypothetical protein [Mucilaginibacter sp.]